jgi:hypothetical protein
MKRGRFLPAAAALVALSSVPACAGRSVQATPRPAPAQAPAGDARALLRGELIELQRLVRTAINRTRDPMTRLHLRDVDLEITRILDPARR